MQGTECPAEKLNNTVEIQVPYETGVRYSAENTTSIEDIIGYEALFDSLQKCKRYSPLFQKIFFVTKINQISRLFLEAL